MLPFVVLFTATLLLVGVLLRVAEMKLAGTRLGAALSFAY